MDSDGTISGARLNERQITPLDLPSDQIGPCYTALRRIFDIVYDPDLRLTFKLKTGEGLLFNNQRVLHGRTEFTPEDPARSVLTTSIDLEEFHSTLRMLHASVEDEGLTKIYSQGMAV